MPLGETPQPSQEPIKDLKEEISNKENLETTFNKVSANYAKILEYANGFNKEFESDGKKLSIVPPLLDNNKEISGSYIKFDEYHIQKDIDSNGVVKIRMRDGKSNELPLKDINSKLIDIDDRYKNYKNEGKMVALKNATQKYDGIHTAEADAADKELADKLKNLSPATDNAPLAQSATKKEQLNNF